VSTNVNWSLYERRLKIDGETFKDRQINSLKDAILEDFEDSPSFHSVKINDIDRGVQILDENAINKNPNKKRVLCKPDEDINTGDEIFWKNKYWLCTNVDSDKEIYAKGIIEKCNNTLKWQTSTGEIKEYPCIISDKSSTYADGTLETKYIVIADDQILITIQSNSDTIQLEVDKRFIFNHSKNDIYKLSKVQSLIQEGILYLTMTKDQYGVNDRLDLNLADYVQNNYILTITNGDSISLTNTETLQLSVTLTNNGVPVENPTVVYSSSNEEICTVSTTGLIQPISEGVVTITAVSNGVSDTIEVTVEEVVADNYSIEFVSPSLTLYQGQSKTYNVKTYNNGLEITDKAVVFTISDVTLASITSQNGLSCVVKGSSSLLGTTTLKCALVDDDTVFSQVNIQIKSIM
jgi:hypothetical protein